VSRIFSQNKVFHVDLHLQTLLDLIIRLPACNPSMTTFFRLQAVLVYADDVNILSGNIHTIRKNRRALIIASKEIGLETTLRKLSIWSCLEVRMQDKMGTYKSVINHLKLWNSLNIWEEPL
jgi:hypothetical protein